MDHVSRMRQHPDRRQGERTDSGQGRCPIAHPRIDVDSRREAGLHFLHGPAHRLGDTRVRRLLVVSVAMALMVLLAPPAVADPPGLVWSVSIDDRDLGSVSRNDPLLLGTSDSARVRLSLDNRGPSSCWCAASGSRAG